MSIPMEIFNLVTAENPLCTLNEVQTVYSTEDVYDMLEMMEVKYMLIEDAQKK